MKNSELERLFKSAFGSTGFSTQATNADWEKMESLLSDQKPAATFGWLPYGAIAASVATVGVAIMMYFNDADIPQYAHANRITSPIVSTDLLPSSTVGSQQQFVIHNAAHTEESETQNEYYETDHENFAGHSHIANNDQSTPTQSTVSGSTDGLEATNAYSELDISTESLAAMRTSIHVGGIQSLTRTDVKTLPTEINLTAKNLNSITENESSLLHLEISLLGGVEFTPKMEQQPLVNRSISSQLSLSAAATPIFGGQVSVIKNNFALTTGVSFATQKQSAQLGYSTEQANIETYTTTRVETNVDSTLIDNFLKPYHNPETGRLELTYEETYAYDTTTIEHVEEHQKEVIDTLQHAWSGQVVVSSFRIPLTVGYRKPLGKWTLMANGGMQFSVNKVTVVSDTPAGELTTVLNVVEQEVRSALTPSISFMASVGAGYQIGQQWRVDAAVKSSMWKTSGETRVLPTAQLGLTYSLF